MTRLRHAPCFLVLLLALGAPAVAAPPSGLDTRIDLELEKAEAQKVLASFGQILGAEASIDPTITGTVTIEVHHVRTATALTAVCESVGCVWTIEDGKLTIRRDSSAPMPESGPPATQPEGPEALDSLIDISLDDAGLRETLLAFGSIAGLPVEIDDALEGKVTIELQDTPARKALDAVCATHGCRWEVVETAKGAVVRITPR